MLNASIKEKLLYLYPEADSGELFNAVERKVTRFLVRNDKTKSRREISEKDVFLITYGDTIRHKNMNPLSALRRILDEKTDRQLPNIHILPFYPFSSDDGFSVIDYFKVDPDLGGWEDISGLSEKYNLMFDGVINHISARSDWFQNYLKGDERFSRYFIEIDPQMDLSAVTRPRALPLLTPFETKRGHKHIWTTFSEDQVDLDFSNEEVFLRILELIFFYIEKGAAFLRLDAIGFLWKEIGTSCIHLPQTHEIIKVFREIIELVRKDFLFITETNVPHKDNISYFGNGSDEASMVYQFPLPPLLLHALLNGDGSRLSHWASSLESPSEDTTFFNFLASHDGIGLNPARGILSENEILEMGRIVVERGGHVSNKKNPDGSESPYELNISLFNALSEEGERESTKVRKFLLAHALQMSLAGTPAIYIHSLLGSENDNNGVEATGRFRSINREKLDYDDLMRDLEDESTIRSQIFMAMIALIRIRRSCKAFHPNGKQMIENMGNQFFALTRIDSEGEKLFCLYNLSAKKQIARKERTGYIYKNLITGEKHKDKIIMEPFGYGWFTMENGNDYE